MRHTADSLIVFLVPPKKFTNGGIISIFSLCEETRAIRKNSKVAIATYPGTPTYGKHDGFRNDEVVYTFEDILKRHQSVKSLILHIPEYSVSEVAEALNLFKKQLSTIDYLHINILNQNIDLMPPIDVVASLYKFTDVITQTTAHLKYTNQELADTYGIPIHLFSVRIDEAHYIKQDFDEKPPLVLVSPDPHPQKDEIISMIKSRTRLQVREIRDLTYEEYKNAIANAKFVLTFGEGMDGYFIESLYSNTVAFAVYNDRFFPSTNYLNLKNVFHSYDDLSKNIISLIKELDNDKKAYNEIVAASAKLLKKTYDESIFVENVTDFYNKKYTFTPKKGKDWLMARKSIGIKDDLLINDRNAIHSLKKELEDSNRKINELEHVANYQRSYIESMENSNSWKITKPLRKIMHLFRRSE